MKNFKVIRFTNSGFYNGAFRHYMDLVNPNWDQESFTQNSAKWFSQFYIYGDSFSYWMKKIGNDAHDFVSDNSLLQQKWALENNIPFDEKNWFSDIVLAQIGFYKPDVVYCQDIGPIPEFLRTRIKIIFPFVKKLVIFRGYPGGTVSYFQIFRDADIFICGAPSIVKKMGILGAKAHLCYHAFDTRILAFLSNSEKIFDCTFIGTSGQKTTDHHQRFDFLKKAINLNLLTVFSNDFQIDKKSKGFKRLLNKVLNFSKDKNKISPGKFGLEMYKTIASSKISFNIHSDISLKAAENMRTFQTTGVGSCLLTNAADNLSELFIEDSEVVTYKSFSEFQSKLKYLLSNEKEINKISAAGQKRTLENHSWEERAKLIHHIIASSL